MPGGGYFLVQFPDRKLAPEQAVFLLALHAHPLALMEAINIHSCLRLAAPSILLRVVLPDIAPEIETERFERCWIIWRVPSLNVRAHGLSPLGTLLIYQPGPWAARWMRV